MARCSRRASSTASSPAPRTSPARGGGTRPSLILTRALLTLALTLALALALALTLTRWDAAERVWRRDLSPHDVLVQVPCARCHPDAHPNPHPNRDPDPDPNP